MPDRKRVNLTVNPERKEKWKNAVEESNRYTTLSQLIRQSVESEISDSGGKESTGNQQNAGDGIHTKKLEEITSTLSNIQKQIVELEDRVVNVEKEVTAEQNANLKNAVYAALPKESNENEPDGKTAEDIAEDIGESHNEVSKILRKLQETTGTVDEAFTLDKGQTAWVRTE